MSTGGMKTSIKSGRFGLWNLKIFSIRQEVRILWIVFGYLIIRASRSRRGWCGIGVDGRKLIRDANGFPDNVEEGT